jgi:hypothetical protein
MRMFHLAQPMDAISPVKYRPSVCAIGRFDQPEFHEAAQLLCAAADVHFAPDCKKAQRLLPCAIVSPELIVIAQERPGVFLPAEVKLLRRLAPLAGMVSLAGTWCEGEPRTGRPWAGVHRLYWYEFPAWWRRQMELVSQECCPDWSRHVMDAGGGELGAGSDLQCSAPMCSVRGCVALAVPSWNTADALREVFQRAGFTTAWHPRGRTAEVAHGLTAGVWEGGQLNDKERTSLEAFCRQLAPADAPVVALLDFPRYDARDRALAAGAAAVLGKPWNNLALLETVQWSIMQMSSGRPRRHAA